MRSRITLIAALAALASHAASARADDLARGKWLYTEHCAACHGAQLEGAPDWQRRGPDGRFPAPPHDEAGHTWHHGDGFLFDYTSRGGQAVLDDLGVAFDSGMPGFAGLLTEDEINAILAFIRSTWPPDMRAFQAARTAQENVQENAQEEGR